MRALAVSVLVAGLAAGSHAQQPEREIDASLIAGIESEMVMPKGAKALTAYQRFYAVTEIDERLVVRGVYVAGAGAQLVKRFADPVPGVSGAHAMKSGRDLPAIMGGGCSVVETVFDLHGMLLRTTEAEKPGVPTPTAFCHAE